MANRLLTKLGEEYNRLVGDYETILNRCHDEDRDPDDTETDLLDALRAEMDPLGERIVQLRETEDRKAATTEALTTPPENRPEGDRKPVVQVRSEPEVYRNPTQVAHPADRQLFFRDLMHAQLDGDPDARARLDRHSVQMRALGTTGTGSGVVPPTWLFEEFAIIAHGARPWADALRRVGITDANPVNIGVQQTPGAAVTAQASEGTAPNDGSFNAGLLTTSPKTYTGKVDVSRQLVDGSNPAIDGIIYADCMGSYNEQVESAVVAAFEAATGMAATITFPGTAPVYANLFDAFIDASASVRKHRKSAPKVVLCSEGAWAYMAKEKDSQGRPLVVTGYHGPVNAYGLGESVTYGQIAGEVVGLQVIPSWAGVDNHLYVVKADDSLLLESSTFNFRYEEVLGPEAIRLGVWGYAAPVIGRYPASIAKVDAGTTIPAPAMEERERAAHEIGKSDSEGDKGSGGPQISRGK
jgi:HK97 family phage major capsid protein